MEKEIKSTTVVQKIFFLTLIINISYTSTPVFLAGNNDFTFLIQHFSYHDFFRQDEQCVI